MKIYATVTIKTPIELPESWTEEDDIQKAFEIADYHFNDKLTNEEALNEVLGIIKEQGNDGVSIHFEFSREEG